jgi:nucleoid DNA-binding protein
MTKSELINELFTTTGVKKADLKDVLDALAAVVHAELVAMPGDGKIVIPGIVTLKKRQVPARPARMGRNPQTGEAIRIAAKPAHLDVKAKVDKDLKAVIVRMKARKA